MRGMKIKQSILTTEEARNKFLTHCEVKNLSAQTIKTYGLETKYFMEWFGEEKPIAEVSAEVIEEYILSCKKSGKS